jgi:hypothetical protein
MKYTVLIDDSSKTGAGLMEVVRSVAKSSKSIKITRGVDEDDWLAEEMIRSKESGKADKLEMLKRFNIE